MAPDERELPYMRLWVPDLLADDLVQELDLEEFGAYMRLLCIAWRRGHIPADPKRRAKLLGISAARERAIWELLGSKWVANGNGGLVNRRQERERDWALNQSASASKAANARWSREREAA